MLGSLPASPNGVVADAGVAAAPPPRRAVLRAIAILGSGSATAVAIGLAQAKAYALILGPRGFGFYGLAQNLLTLTVIAGGLSLPSAVVRLGARAAGADEGAFRGLLKTAWRLTVIGTALVCALLLAAARPVARWALDDAAQAAAIPTVAVGVAFALAAALQTGVVNARQHVGALAKINVGSSVFGAGVGTVLLWRFGMRAVPFAAIAPSIGNWLVSRYYYDRAVPRSARVVAPEPGASRDLVRYGGALTLSVLFGSGMQYVLPIIVGRELGIEAVGLVRAAQLMAIGYLGLFLAAMSQDYFPRVAALGGDPGQLAGVVDAQLSLMLTLGTPLLAAVIAFADLCLRLAYSRAFLPATELLAWTMFANVPRLASWAFSYVVMARGSARRYLQLEMCGGALTLVCCWTGMRLGGLRGFGIGLATAAFVYLALAVAAVRLDTGYRPSWRSVRILAAAVAGTALCLAAKLSSAG